MFVPPNSPPRRLPRGQTVDKTTDFRQLGESFDQTFSKVCATENCKNSLREFYFVSCNYTVITSELAKPISFVPFASKRKAANKFVQINIQYAFGLL